MDEEDLDLIGEANPDWERKTAAQVRCTGKATGAFTDHRSSPSLNVSSAATEMMMMSVENEALKRCSLMMRSRSRLIADPTIIE